MNKHLSIHQYYELLKYVSDPINHSLPNQNENDEGKMTLVLDIDETMLHTVQLGENPKPEDIIEEDENNFMLVVHACYFIVKKRPFLDSFLLEASKRFEIIVFTASHPEYADALLNKLDPQGSIFKHRLYRHHCACGVVKDLRIVNRDLRRTVIVDNSHFSFLFQSSNGIPISSYISNLNDTSLLLLMEYLLYLENMQDVREDLFSRFQLHTYFSKISVYM